VQSNFAISKKLAYEAIIQTTPPRRFPAPNKFDAYLSLIKSTSTIQYILIPMITLLLDFLWSQLVTKYMPTPIFTPDGGSKAWRTNLGDKSLGWT
ncbi:Bgt-20489, partial [Blumeria graminis f. sp. tritici]